MRGGHFISVFFIFIFSTLVSSGHGLKCWVCSTSINNDCANPTTKTVPYEECSSRRSNTKSVCRIIEYYDRREQRTHTSRACVEEKDESNNEPCSRVRLQFFARVEKCSTCNTDFCPFAGIPQQVAGKTVASNNYAVPVDDRNKNSSATSIYHAGIYVVGLVNLSLLLTRINIF